MAPRAIRDLRSMYPILAPVCNQWKFNVPGINAKVNGSQYELTRACNNFAVYRPRIDTLIKTKK